MNEPLNFVNTVQSLPNSYLLSFDICKCRKCTK